MMFLQFFVWGAWSVPLGTYLGETLGFQGRDIGLVFGTTAVAAMISPFFVGMIADPCFSAQKVLGVLHLAGGAAIGLVPAGALVAFRTWLVSSKARRQGY